MSEETVELQISGMTCASCAARIEKKLNRLPGVEARRPVVGAGPPRNLWPPPWRSHRRR